MILYNTVGELIRVEWDQSTGEVHLVLNITDKSFRLRVLHNKDYKDIIELKGKDAILISSEIDHED